MIDDYTPVAKAAELYASMGLPPILIWGLKQDGTCQCGSPGCTATAKHPIGSGWNTKATTDLDVVRDRFRNHNGNIGVYLGGKFVLIDADGHEGLETLSTLGDLPPTMMALSGSRTGSHHIYRLAPHQDAQRITDRRFAPSVDVKIRGQFVAAPSRHPSGNRYQWAVFQEPAVLPDWLYEMLCSRKPAVVRAPVTDSPDIRRVRAYVAKMPPAVSGQGGHGQTYAAACFIAGQGLSEDEEFAVLDEYNQRCEPPWSDQELEHKLRDARRNTTAQPLADRPRLVSVPADATEDEGWKQELSFTQNRSGDPVIRRTVKNAVMILQNEPLWRGKIRRDLFSMHTRLTDPPWGSVYAPSTASAVWRDSDTSRLQAWLQDKYQLDLCVTDLDAAVSLVAEANEHNSAQEWFSGLTWDGQERAGQWLHTYIGATDTPYNAAVGRWWLISAVARVFQPGCKADHMLILYGDQGVGKSSAAGILAGQEWFSDSPVPIGNKDAYLALQGKLIVEMAELDSMKRAESEAIKAFLTSPTDSFRPPFARRNINVPRQCIFVGTTNQVEMLRDDTGNRRFWPVVTGDINREALRRDRDQIWAEVVQWYRAGATWYPSTAADRAMCREVQNSHLVWHPWVDKIQEWASRTHRDSARLAEILEQALGIPAGKDKAGDRGEAKAALSQAGWRYDSSRKIFLAPDSLDE